MTNKINIGIAGIGMVGGALRRYFEKKYNTYDLFLYDKKGIGSMDELNKADFVYLCLPTPYIGKGFDMSILEKIIGDIKPRKEKTYPGMYPPEIPEDIVEINVPKVIIIKSTVVPGTTDKFQKKYPQHKFLFNPEFLTEETADQDMSFPDRQIVGYTEESYTIAKDVLQQLPLAPYERIVPAFTAEFIKLGANTWFSAKVAKNNELYDVFKAFGGTDEQFEMVIGGIAADKRIGRTHLKIWHKGKRGYWGACLPKDTKAFIDFAKSVGLRAEITEMFDEYNDKLLEKQGLEPLNAPKRSGGRKKEDNAWSSSQELNN